MIFGFGIVELLKAPEEYSLSERRTLAKFPKVTFEKIASGKFMSEFEDYTLDQFPLRDSFRTVKAGVSKYVFLQKDNHDIYTEGGHVSKLEYPANYSRLDISLGKIGEVYGKFIEGTDCKTYLSVVPDKNYFLAPLSGYPSMDYDNFVSATREKTAFASYIDIFDLLELDDYYRTDQHWKQENIIDVAERVASAMGAELTSDYKENILEKEFFGTYAGQSALRFKPDTIKYLTNDILDSCTVTSYADGDAKEGFMYDMTGGLGKDPYDLFLMGTNPLIVIENPNGPADKELVIFRDSFGSSLSPLLVSGYSKITVIDMRYMKSDLITSYVTFDSQDVLFMYSTLVLNNSISM